MTITKQINYLFIIDLKEWNPDYKLSLIFFIVDLSEDLLDDSCNNANTLWVAESGSRCSHRKCFSA